MRDVHTGEIRERDERIAPLDDEPDPVQLVVFLSRWLTPLQRCVALHQHRAEHRVAPAGRPFGQQRRQAFGRVGHRGDLRLFAAVGGDVVPVRVGGDAAHQLGAIGTVEVPAVTAQRPAVLPVGAVTDLIAAPYGESPLFGDPRGQDVAGEPQRGHERDRDGPSDGSGAYGDEHREADRTGGRTHRRAGARCQLVHGWQATSGA